MVEVTIVGDRKVSLSSYYKNELDIVLTKAIPNKWDCLALFIGREGCLTGDTLINVNRGGNGRTYTLKKIYKEYNQPPNVKGKAWNLENDTYVRSFNGKSIQLHKMKAVTYSGKKQVAELVLESGHKIKATCTHKIMTNKGWVLMSQLNINNKVMIDTPNATSVNRVSYKLRDAHIRVPNHPYKNKSRKEVEVHRLIYEANFNKLSFNEYLDILWNDEDASKRLTYVNPEKYCIHHKDGFHYNNSIDNLELMLKEDHQKLHGNFANFNQGVPLFSKIKEINVLGVEDTYDIECEEPYHNFVANGIVVHNSGKSTLAMQTATYLDHTFNLKRCVFTPDQFVEACTNAEPEQSIVWDEAITGANVQKHASETSQTIISMLTQIRKKKLKIMLCFPYLYMLNKYFVSRCLFGCYVYAKGFDKRGFGHFYHQGQMEKTYNMMKEKYRYSPNYAFRAAGKSFSLQFGNKFCLDEDEYDVKKTESIMSLAKKEKENLWKNKTLILAEYMNKELGVTHKKMSELLKCSRPAITQLLNVST